MHSRVVTRQFSDKKTPQLAHPRNGAVLEPDNFRRGSPTENALAEASADHQEQESSLNIQFLGGIFLGHPEPRRRDIPDKNFMQVAFFCCFRQGVAGMSRDLGRDVPDLEKLYAAENFGLIFRTLSKC